VVIGLAFCKQEGQITVLHPTDSSFIGKSELLSHRSQQLLFGQISRLPVNVTPRTWVKDLLARAPFAHRSELRSIWARLCRAYDYAVAVPVRNEDAFLPQMLEALDAAIENNDSRGAFVFVLNNTDDGSAALIQAWAITKQREAVIVEVDFAPAIRNAPHARRLACDIAAQCLNEGVILTTDADTMVGPEWISQMVRSIDPGNALVCEDVQLNDVELRKLPPIVERVGQAERDYFAASERVWKRWSDGSSGAFAYRASGASMAVAKSAYLAIGKLPVPPCGEDAALCKAVLAQGYRVAQLPNLGTITSARLEGRADGGCGETLEQRSRSTDPFCDPALVPIETLREHALRNERPPLLGQPLRFSEVCIELQRARDILGEAD
jgi:hypothetical protein